MQTLKLHLLTVNTHHYGNLHFLHHAHVRFNHFNHALWVAVLCEASEATPAVAEASEASGSYLYNIIHTCNLDCYVSSCFSPNLFAAILLCCFHLRYFVCFQRISSR